MATITRIFVSTGLSALASFGLAFGVGSEPDTPAPLESPPANRAPESPEEFLLLTDGRLIQGVVAREGSTFVVTMKLGVIRFPERRVEKSFHTIREAYAYKSEQVPDSDPGERMKLAQWCLTRHLMVEAQDELAKVLAISPEHARAKAMLASIRQSEALAARRKLDPEIRQTRADAVGDDQPGALDSAVLRGAQRGMGLSGLPVIFDLPRPLAIKRAEEFARYVQPVLQAYCAKCHDSEYPGGFQLVAIRSRRDQTADALRANLDATLNLINREHPSDSKLLTSVLRPHGEGRNKRAIFPGSNNRAYQILATWVNSVCPAKDCDAAARPVGDGPAADSGEVFAADRSSAGGPARARGPSRPGPANPRVVATPVLPNDGRSGPSYRYVPGQGMVPEQWLPSDPREFPLPYLLGGPRPAMMGGTDPRGAANPAVRPSQPGTTAEALPPLPGDPANSPAGPAPATGPEGSPKAATGKANTPRKALNLHPALLQRVLNPTGSR